MLALQAPRHPSQSSQENDAMLIVRSSCFAVLTACLASVTTAQQLVFPTSGEGASHGTIPGVRRDFRQQILIPDRALMPMRGAVIEALTFRRDARYSRVLEGGAVDLVVTMSMSSRDPQAASATFTDNHAQPPTTVFQGRLAIPPSPAVFGTPSFDDVLQTLRVPLTNTFSYAAGTLVIDITGTGASQASSLWPVDYAIDQQNGNAVVRGVGCGRWAAPTSRNMSVSRDGLVPGSVVRFVTWTSPNGIAVLMLGDQPVTFSLAPLGAPGCWLLVNPVASLPVIAANRGPGPGVADLRFQFPASTNLLSAAFPTQWAHVEVGQTSNPLGLTTSNAADVMLASNLPTLGSGLVTSLPATAGVFPDRGDVSLQRVPVVRFEYR
jgi:hypothetical protein